MFGEFLIGLVRFGKVWKRWGRLGKIWKGLDMFEEVWRFLNFLNCYE
jgi:hypothetical protein